MIHKLLLDTVEYSSKPDNNSIKSINNRIVNNPVDINIVEFSKQVTTPHGKTWIPAYIKGARNNNNWKSQSIFALDFDKNITFIQVLDNLKEYGLDCAFAYETFSNTAEIPKFRVIFQLNQSIIERDNRNFIQLHLMTLFLEADKACKDASRIFFGGKEIIYENYDYYLNLDLLSEAAEFCAIKYSSNKNMARDLKRAKKTFRLSKNGSKHDCSYINNIEITLDASKKFLVDNVNWGDLRSSIRILNDFMNPEIKLLDPQLFGLATNLRYLSGGQELYKDCLKKNLDYNYQEKIKKLQQCKISGYAPMKLEKFSPYEEDWSYVTLLNAARKKEIIRLQKHTTMTIDTARQKLKEIFNTVINSNDTNVHILKVATGLGKTELCTSLSNVVLAYPNHGLKAEIAKERMKVAYKLTPNIDNLPQEVRKHLDYLYSIGAISEATRYLAGEAKVDEQVKNYRKQCFDCYETTDTVLTTHQKALFIEWKHDTIIFDEDALQSLLPTGKVFLTELMQLEANIRNSNDKRVLNTLIDDIRSGRVNTARTFDIPVFEEFKAIENEVTGNKKYYSNILQFFDASYFAVDANDVNIIHFIRKHELPQDKKIIILSATADETIYKALLGNRLRFYDVSNVETTGLVLQDSTYSFSRTSLNKHLDYVADSLKSSNKPTITFSTFKDTLERMGVNVVDEMHFGRTNGFDTLKGLDIAVVGTPHINPITISLYATLLGMPVKTSDFKTHQQTVEHNGFRFWFNTYDNEYLRSLQFFFIESELKQAIGRARVNTELCTVNVYSNYPLPEACVTQEEKEKVQKSKDDILRQKQRKLVKKSKKLDSGGWENEKLAA